MAERTQEETEQTTGSAGEESGASANGDDQPSGTLSTGVALTIGGAVVGALLALLHGRRASESNGTDAGRESRLADDLVARASAAARGDEGTDEHDEVEESDEGDAEAVAVAQGADAESTANGDPNGDLVSEREDPESRADSPEHEASEHEEEGGTEAAAPSATREERDTDGGGAEQHEHESRAAGSARAEEEPGDDARSAREEDGRGRGSGAFAAASAAARQLGELTARAPESVLGVERRDGGWRVTLEVVEVARTPPTTDVLGRYEVELDGDGELVEYHQVGRYVRGRAAEGG